MRASALLPPQVRLGWRTQASATAASGNRISRFLKILKTWLIRSSVSRGMRPPSFFHLKNVDRAGLPSSTICSSVERPQRPVISKNASSVACDLARPSAASTASAGDKFMHVSLRSRFILDDAFLSEYLLAPDTDRFEGLVQSVEPSRVGAGGGQRSPGPVCKCERYLP